MTVERPEGLPAGPCANCGSALTGPFCAQCGQPARSLEVPWYRFLAEAAGELFSLDSRLTGTLKPLLLRPGYVAHEYSRGRRARFVPPVRLYLFVSFVFFVLMAMDGSASTAISVTEPSSDVDVQLPTGGEDAEPGVLDRFFERMGKAVEDQDALVGAVSHRLGQVMFFLVPIFALLLKLAYRRHFYVQHLVYALYFHVMVFSLLILAMIPNVFGLTRIGEVVGLAQLWIPVYLYLGLRRVYEESRRRTLAKTGAILGVYLAALLMGMLVALVLAVWW